MALAFSQPRAFGVSLRSAELRRVLAPPPPPPGIRRQRAPMVTRICSSLAGLLPQPVQLRTSGDPRRTWPWTAEQMPPQDGKVFVVTGASSGMGRITAENIAKKGGHVIIASRNLEKAQTVVREIKQAGARGEVEGMLLDLASFQSVAAFARAFLQKGLPLHCLVCNAGVFLVPFGRTQEGFEQTLGINYFGHVLLTHLLLDKLRETVGQAGGARIVLMASLFELLGGVDWNDLGGRSATDSSLPEYSASKLMTIMFGRELNKRLRGSGVEVFACQPGLVESELTTQKLDKRKLLANAMELSARIYGWKSDVGSLCLQRAATDPQLTGHGGSYLTPPFLGVLALNLDHAGVREPSNRLARDERAWARLYDDSLRLVNGPLESLRLPHVQPVGRVKAA